MPITWQGWFFCSLFCLTRSPWHLEIEFHWWDSEDRSISTCQLPDRRSSNILLKRGKKGEGMAFSSCRTIKCTIFRNHFLIAGPPRSPSLNHGFPISIAPGILSYYLAAFSFDTFSAWHSYAPQKLKSRWKWPDCLVIRMTLLSWSPSGFISSQATFFPNCYPLSFYSP